MNGPEETTASDSARLAAAITSATAAATAATAAIASAAGQLRPPGKAT